MGGTSTNRLERNGYPAIYNIETDPREEHDVGADASWITGQYLRLVRDYYASVRKYPNPRPANIVNFSEEG